MTRVAYQFGDTKAQERTHPSTNKKGKGDKSGGQIDSVKTYARFIPTCLSYSDDGTRLAVRCSLLQCVAVCCSGLQCVAVCCSPA